MTIDVVQVVRDILARLPAVHDPMMEVLPEGLRVQFRLPWLPQEHPWAMVLPQDVWPFLFRQAVEEHLTRVLRRTVEHHTGQTLDDTALYRATPRPEEVT